MIFVSRPLRIGKSENYGVTYPRETIEAMVSKWESDGKPALFGVIDQSPESIQSGTIDLDKIATQIVAMSVDDEGLVIEQEVLDTPKGQELENFLQVLDDEPTLVGMKLTPYMAGTVGPKDSEGYYPITTLRIRALLFEVTV